MTTMLGLTLEGRDVVFIGGGDVAARRMWRMLQDGARVSVVAPEVSDDVRELIDAHDLPWTARRVRNGAFVGWFCLWPESDTLAELGYRLRRMDWGQGLASEGASALVHWGFETGGYDRIVATTMAVNQASRRVMEKIGMTYARTTPTESSDPIPGREHGEVWYELTRSGWTGG